MPEIEEEVTFHTTADQVRFSTRTNGDSLSLGKLNLTQMQATTITWLVNADDNAELEFQIKVKP